MSDIRFNQWLHNSGTGGVSQVDGGHVGIGTTNPEIAVHSGNNKILNVGIVTASTYYGDGSNLSGVQVGGASSLSFNDNIGVYFGNTQDLKIHHDGNHSYIDDQGTGNLRLRSGTLEILNLAGNKTSAIFSSGGGQTLNFNNSTKFVTTNTGAVVTGILTATSINSTGYMGAGTNNPQARLEVKDGANNYGTSIRLSQGYNSVFSEVASNFGGSMTLNAGQGGGQPIMHFQVNDNEKMRLTNSGNLALGNTHASKRLHISNTGNQKVLIDPNYNNNSGGSSNAEANANNIVESILIRTSFGENAATQTNAGHKWGIKFQGYNGNDFTQARSKCAGVFAVSEDTGAGYNRNVGLAFHTSQFDTAHREVMRINTNGIVTKPYQYMFTVSTTNHSKSANWSQITNHAPIAAQCTNVSDGNNWSNSTQRFTAPVAGVYHFFVGGWSYGNSNGSRYAYCFKHTNGNNYTFIGGGDYCSGDSPMAGWSRDIKLSAGEWVELWGYSAISVRWGGGHHFFWGGYLLG